MRLLQFCRTKEIINQSNFKIHYRVQQRDGELLSKPKMLSDDILGPWIGGSWYSAELTISKRFSIIIMRC